MGALYKLKRVKAEVSMDQIVGVDSKDVRVGARMSVKALCWCGFYICVNKVLPEEKKAVVSYQERGHYCDVIGMYYSLMYDSLFPTPRA